MAVRDISYPLGEKGTIRCRCHIRYFTVSIKASVDLGALLFHASKVFVTGPWLQQKSSFLAPMEGVARSYDLDIVIRS